MERRIIAGLISVMSLMTVASASDLLPGNRFVADFDIQASDAQVAWMYEPAEEGLSDPCVVDGIVYVGTDVGMVLGFRCDTGEQVLACHHGERVYRAPVCDGTHLFVSSTKWVEAFSCETGESVWKKPIHRGGGLALWPTRPPGPNKLQMLYVGSGDGHFNGYLAWKGVRRLRGTLMKDVPPNPPGFAGNRARASNSIVRPYGASTDGERIYQSVFDQSRVIAFSAASCRVVWTFNTQGWVGPTPVVDGEDVFIGSRDQRLYCVDSRTGEMKWEYEAASRISAAPAVNSTHVFAGSCDGHMFCLDRTTGREIWTFRDPEEPESVIYTDPIVTETTAYYAVAKGVVYALSSSNGQLRWRLRPVPESQLYADFATDGTRLFISSRPAATGAGKYALIALGPSEPHGNAE